MEALKVSRHVDNWNDDRLDELARGTKDGFAKVDTRFDKVEGEMKAGFAKLEREMKAGFEKSDQRLEAAIGKLSEQIKESEGRLEARMDRLESRRAKLQGWIWGIVGTAFGALVSHFA